MRTKVPMVMLLLGLAMLWPLPIGGALLLVAAGVSLAIAWEADMAGDQPFAPAPPPGAAWVSDPVEVS